MAGGDKAPREGGGRPAPGHPRFEGSGDAAGGSATGTPGGAGGGTGGTGHTAGSTGSGGLGPILEVRPSWWNFVRGFLLFFVVLPFLLWFVLVVVPPFFGATLDLEPWMPFIVGLLVLFYVLPPMAAMLKRASVKLRVYGDRLVLERGILSKETKELFVSDVRSLDTYQSMAQRIVRTGDLMIASSGTDEYEYVVEGIPRPEEVKELIVAQRRGQSGGGGGGPVG